VHQFLFVIRFALAAIIGAFIGLALRVRSAREGSSANVR
jgi:hypothetical protein